MSWSAISGASDYQIKYADELNAETIKAVTTGLTDTIPCGSATGKLMTVQLQYRSGGISSGYSVGVSMMCADLPGAVNAPSVLIQDLDQIVIEWSPPTSNGGTPILGYQVDMKQSGGSYTQIYDGSENPGTRILDITQYNSAALQVTTYTFRVRALNWVGVGPNSAETTVILASETSPTTSVVSGTGIGTIRAYVTAEVDVLAKDSSGTNRGVGGDLFELVVTNA